MSENRDLPRGLEGLRKLADDVMYHLELWQMIDCDAEKDWNVSVVNKGNLHKTLERLADEIKVERPALTEAERRVLEMWPRFEDGEPVMPGDRVALEMWPCSEGEEVENVCRINIERDGFWLRTDTHYPWYSHEKRVKRPAPDVLDADGAPIHVGDTVWIIPECSDTPDEPHKVRRIDKWGEVLLEFHLERSTGLKGQYLTHTRPDSWERLEKDAREFARDNQPPRDVDQMERDALDLVRRAKALAGVER